MTEDLQPSHHLSSDQLSAFAENVLPEHERRAALTHLAGCADCRQVVFLAQQADPTHIAPVSVAETSRRNWFTLPQIFGAATAALACLLILALLIHQRHTETLSAPPVTTARVEPHATLTPPTSVPAPAPQPSNRAALSSAAVHSPALTLKPESQPVPPPSFRFGSIASSHASDTGQADRQAFGTNSTVSANTYAALPPKAPSGTASGAPMPMPIPPESRLREGYTDSTTSGKDIAADAMTAPSPAAPPPYAGKANDSVNTASYQELPLLGRSITNNAKAKATAPIQLPSKKPAANILQASGHMLALDTAGALFVSLDLGKHWTAVTPQWSGKAVLISYAPTPARLYLQQPAQNQVQNQSNNSSNGGLANNTLSPQQAPIPAAGFDLTTATGAVWHSTDGINWHAR